jgi:putative ABC transport system permease protein
MSTIAPAPPAPPDVEQRRPPNGGAPARRAVARWGVRLLRREWRQQLLVIGLLMIAVATTVTGLAMATNAPYPASTAWILPGSDSQVATDINAIQAAFGPVSVFAHHSVQVPGSIASLDEVALEPGTPFPSDNLRLLEGRLPSNGDEVAVTRGVASEFGLGVGDTWQDLGRAVRVAGIVQDPTSFDTQFALVGGQLDAVDNISVRVQSDVPSEHLRAFHLPSGSVAQINDVSSTAKTQAAVAVLALGTLTLLFVGLVSVASYSVIAQRRQRALGMLASMGATDRHVRLVMLANGAAAGLAAAVGGAVLGLFAWFVYEPYFEHTVAHSVDRFDLPWWAFLAAVALAVGTSTAAAWWPARTMSRGSIVTALAARPPRPKPPGRLAVTGALVLAVGLLLLAFGRPDRAPAIIFGTVAAVIGVVLLGPLAIRGAAALAARFPVSIRLALRDLARYQTRSGAALGAATLAIAIAGIITVSAASSIARDAANGGNLPANEMMIYLSEAGPKGGPALQDTTSELDAARSTVDAIAERAGGRDFQLDMAVDPNAPTIEGLPGGPPPAALVEVGDEPGGGHSLQLRQPLYVATPELLAADGINPNSVDQTADIITSRSDIAGLQLMLSPREPTLAPRIQHLDLPTGTSEPNTLLTEHALARLGLNRRPGAWLLRTAEPLTAAQTNTARRTAAPAGLSIETRNSSSSLVALGHDASVGGILFALVVLAMTVGLIRSETANDLRILSATGASSFSRRNLTAATSGTLALLAALLGLAVAYLALGAFYRSSLDTLNHPPIADLVMIAVGLPVIAAVAGWLIGGRQPPNIARRPLE